MCLPACLSLASGWGDQGSCCHLFAADAPGLQSIGLTVLAIGICLGGGDSPISWLVAQHLLHGWVLRQVHLRTECAGFGAATCARLQDAQQAGNMQHAEEPDKPAGMRNCSW